ncbi:MAG: hypothetical protein ABI263_10160 [Gelidibacter sp.]
MTLYTKGLEDFKEHLTLYVPLSIIFQSCLGSVAAMFILKNSFHSFRFIDLILVVSFAMAYNGSLYAQLKPKVIYNLLIATILVHTTFLIINMVGMG